MERLLHCGRNQAATGAVIKRLQRCSGEKHEDLSADDAHWCTFDRDSLHFRAGAAIEDASAIAGLLKA
jgi:hypothetical protein